MTVRNEDGDIINPDHISTVELYRDHKKTVERNTKRRDEQVESKVTQRHTLNLFVSVCNVICRVGDEADVIMALYDSKRGKFFRLALIPRLCNKQLGNARCQFILHLLMYYYITVELDLIATEMLAFPSKSSRHTNDSDPIKGKTTPIYVITEIISIANSDDSDHFPLLFLWPLDRCYQIRFYSKCYTV